MKQKYIDLYMDWAQRTAELSHARRLHVGAVIVKDDTVISYGYNGMPAGWDNNCEDILEDGTTKPDQRYYMQKATRLQNWLEVITAGLVLTYLLLMLLALIVPSLSTNPVFLGFGLATSIGTIVALIFCKNQELK